MGELLYDRDFYTWTQDQAARLRDLAGDNRLDVANLAEEVADLGRNQLNKVDSHLRELCVHLLKLAWVDDDRLEGGWVDEVLTHQDDARKAFAPGMRQHLDVADIWRRAWRRADRSLQGHGDPRLPAFAACPFDLDQLLDPDFDLDDAARRVRARLETDGF